MLRIDDLHVSYGHIQALSGVSISVPEGSIVSIIGSNGAGKTTLLNTISGLVKQKKGSILFKGQELTRTPHHVVKMGLVQVPEGRKIFAGLTVEENLLAGGYVLSDAHKLKNNLEKMMQMYPILGKRRSQQAGTLSGGEQQMLAVCRGLMSEPKMILLDEPSLGLAPLIVKGIFELIARIREDGLTVLLVEQNAKKALALSDYAYVLENGRVVMEGPGKQLLCDPNVKKAYLGEGE
jgi:branched-chain amino acid transport system ATP-binding protein